jgi:uncharacterized membrane protein YphA (DoxX/SURF4 family)
MATTHRLLDWTEAHRDVAFDLIRIYLGLGLLVRGWYFILDSTELVNLVAASGDSTFISAAIVHYVALAHFGGGLLLAVGLLTRVAALVQIPVLVGAVFFVHLGEGLLATGQSLEFSALVLFLLVVIFFHGSGRLSLDYYLFEREEAKAARAAQLGLFESARSVPIEEVPGAVDREVRRPATAGVEAAPDRAPVQTPPQQPAQEVAGCTCDGARDRNHPRVRVERRYGMRALRFLTGTTGTPREIAFRCRDCGHVVEESTDERDIAHYTYR